MGVRVGVRVGATHQHVAENEQQDEHQRRLLLHGKKASDEQTAAHEYQHHEGNREQVDEGKEQAETPVVVAVEDPLGNGQGRTTIGHGGQETHGVGRELVQLVILLGPAQESRGQQLFDLDPTLGADGTVAHDDALDGLHYEGA